ncbi:LON peptidase substrate-binding domain-containing protein [Salmonirosea aquatica]|uniref:Peptidase n=1 Tax=Salmonirosea aquatica TaxID=2654236 RepID=A0A7C9FD18_9BACT|nr:peptidase [Cytophagaceae bacterium SJW1-29]
MSVFLPFFPLNLVAYPGEKLNLHIFEERYRQLINECLESGGTFGIPTYLDNRLPGCGTEMRVRTLHERHPDGSMDISTEGLRVFRIDSFDNPVADKLYAGGEITYLPEETDLIRPLPQLTELLDKLYGLLATPVAYDREKKPFSFQVAHKVGLSLQDEYELLTLSHESARQQFLIQHLQKVIPVVSEMEQTKSRIRMNGHFKNLDPLNF